MADVAQAAEDRGDVLDGNGHFAADGMTFPNGCHACEVEIDPETGETKILGYWAVDDFGRLVNPLLLEGQVQGGLAQGVGQALLERCVYDESGQLVSGSFMDYCMPRADDLPNMTVELVEDFPCVTNPLGINGAGEAGAVAAPPTVINAILTPYLRLMSSISICPPHRNEFGGPFRKPNDPAEKLLTELEALAVDAGNAIMRIYAEDFVAEYRTTTAPSRKQTRPRRKSLLPALETDAGYPGRRRRGLRRRSFAGYQRRRFWLVDPRRHA